MESRKRGASNKVNLNDNNDSNEKNKNYHEVKIYRRYGFNRIFGEVVVPLLLFCSIPLMSFTIWYINAKCKGDLMEFYNIVRQFTSVYQGFDEIILK